MNLTPKPRRGLLATAAVALSALTLTACAGGDTPDTPAASEDVDTSVVRIDLGTNAMALDPIANPLLTDTILGSLSFASLFTFSEGSATATEPVLAESIEASSDGLTHTISLKPSMTFSDGSALDSEDVVSSLLRWRDTPGPHQDDVTDFETVEAVDEVTVEITLSSPVADLTETLALPAAGIVPAEASGDEAYFEGEPAYSGAYIPEGDITANEFSFVRNENFAGSMPVVEELQFSIVQDTVTSATRLQGGEIDLADVPLETVPQLTGDLTAISVERTAGMYIVPNNREDSIFSDVKIRQAIAWAIDREALGSVVFGDEVEVQSGPFPTLADYPETREVYGEQDVDKAKALLEGTACADGCTAEIAYFASTAEAEGRAAVVLQQQLAEIGITIQPTPVESGQFIENSLDGSFDMNMVVSGGFNIPLTFAGAFDTETTFCVYSGCANDEFQPAAKRLIAASDDAEAQAAADEVVDIFEAWTPIIPVSAVSQTYGVTTDLADVVKIQPNGVLWIATQ